MLIDIEFDVREAECARHLQHEYETRRATINAVRNRGLGRLDADCAKLADELLSPDAAPNEHQSEHALCFPIPVVHILILPVMVFGANRGKFADFRG